jgi:hypothetical protein
VHTFKGLCNYEVREAFLLVEANFVFIDIFCFSLANNFVEIACSSKSRSFSFS